MPPKTIDEYLTSVPEPARAALERLRAAIRAAAPKAEETIGYQIPIFKLDGKPLVGFSAAKSHCTFQVMSPAVIAAHAADLEGYELNKGSVKFTPERPLPSGLVRKLVKARITENKK